MNDVPNPNLVEAQHQLSQPVADTVDEGYLLPTRSPAATRD